MRKDEREVKEAPELELQYLRSELQRTRQELTQSKALYVELENEKDALIRERDAWQIQYNIIAHSTVWKMTKPIRLVLDVMKRIARKIPPLRLLGKFIRSLSKNGWRATMHKVKLYRSKKKGMRLAKRVDLSCISAKKRALEEATVFAKEICFSILVPLYNTPIPFLNEMIASVQGQTYSNWELCLADGSDAEHADVEKTVLCLAQKDPRIKYCKLEKNLGISENTNACIEMATGNFIALFDHDDILHPSALFEMMKAICESDADMVYTDEVTFISPNIKKLITIHHKPDFAPDMLRSYNYICHFTAFSRELLNRVGVFRSEFDGSQDYDMILRLTEMAQKIVHVPKILYFWRSHEASVASNISAKPYTLAAARRALAEHLERVGLKGTVSDSRIPSTYRIRYELEGAPLVSIIIPNADHVDVLEQCIESVEKLSTYQNYEILIVENNSKKQETFAFYEYICSKYDNVRLLRWACEFNYSKINNFAAQEAKGDYLLFLNNDIEIITPSWIEEMLMYVQRSDVGAAGMVLYYPDDTVQHAGVILGVGGVAGHSHKYYPRKSSGYMSRLSLVQNLSAVTAASMMVKASVFREVNGFEPKLAVAFNDVDLCMKIRQAGYLIVFTPYAEAYHHESKSRGTEDTPQKVARFNGEVKLFHERWDDALKAGDPYYNPNLTLEHEDFRLA